MARRRRRRVDPLRALSEDELLAQADRLLAGSLTLPRQKIRREQAEARRQAEADAKMIQGFTQALAGIVGQAGGRVDKVYADATTRQQQIAQGLADQQRTGDQAAADRANQLLQAQGQGRRIDPGTGSAVTYALGGMLPANLLNETGAAMSSIAHGYGAGVAGRGQQQLQLRQSQALKEQAKLREAMEELMDRVPGLRSEILDKLYQREISKSATDIQRQYLGLAGNRESFDQQYDLAKLQADIASDAAKSKGNQNKAKLKAREARLKALAAGKEDAISFADELYNRTTNIPGAGEQPDRPTWKEAYAKLWNRYGSGLLRYSSDWNAADKKWWRGQVEAMLVNALKGAGFTKARGTGRG